MTKPVTEPIRRDHAELAEHVEHIRLAAREVPSLSPEERRVLVQRVLSFLEETLLPHADAEERTLYPEIARPVGAPEATAPMIVDHRAISERIAELRATDEGDTDRLQELLYALFALISTHVRKEEELYLPLLDERAGPDVRRALETVDRLEGSRGGATEVDARRNR